MLTPCLVPGQIQITHSLHHPHHSSGDGMPAPAPARDCPQQHLAHSESQQILIGRVFAERGEIKGDDYFVWDLGTSCLFSVKSPPLAPPLGPQMPLRGGMRDGRHEEEEG